VAAADDKMADETDTGGASSAAKTESDAPAAAEAAEKKENGKGKEDNGSKEETKGNGVRKAAEADISSDDEPIPKRNTPKKKSKYESSSGDEDEWKRYFASMCWECKHKAYSCKRCRKEKEHTDIDWRNDDRARTDQQERGVDGTSKTSSPLKSPSTPGGGAARRPQDRDASAGRYLCYACRVFMLYFFSLAHSLVSLLHYIPFLYSKLHTSSW